MDNWRLLLALLYLSARHFLPSSCYKSIGYSTLLIDCGSSNETITEDGDDGKTETWHTDEEFIKSGKNVLLTSNQNFIVMNTLRSLPDGNKNCYELPLNFSNDDYYNKYIIRAGFFYGNYDGLSRPPSFKLEIDGNLWANVTTSMSEEDPVYHKLIYTLKKEQTTVCLVRSSNDEVPFISSIEAAAFHGGYNMSRLMDNEIAALYLFVSSLIKLIEEQTKHEFSLAVCLIVLLLLQICSTMLIL
ncbi:hypothetical protein Q3G72_003529 [Acer saccharum]|nr:hypothetical protein Q3G72_003529 [Acer saccharum]